jgi:hypothetical protein
VTIYEALTNDTGKTRVRAKASTLVAKAIADLKDFYGEQAAERRVLVVTSADPSTQEAVRTAMAVGVFAEWDLTNWRRVDGRNEWAKFDTLLVLSLHYGSSTQDINTWLAVRGLQPDDATLNATDEIRAIKERRIAADLAQAIGRLRLRTMTNPNGTCEPCDVFVRLPNFKGVVDSEKVMAAVASTLPGIVRAKWDRQSRKLRRDGRAPRERGAVVGRLVALADQVAADGVTRELTQETLKTSNGTLHRVFDQVKAGRVELPAGVRLVPGGYAAGVRGQSPATLVRV